MIEMEKDSVNIRVSMAKSQPADRAERVRARRVVKNGAFIMHPFFYPTLLFLSGKEEGGGAVNLSTS